MLYSCINMATVGLKGLMHDKVRIATLWATGHINNAIFLGIWITQSKINQMIFNTVMLKKTCHQVMIRLSKTL